MLGLLGPLIYLKSFWIAAFLISFCAYLKYVVYSYWKRQGIPHDEPLIPFGNLLPVVLQKSSLGNLVRANYMKYKQYPVHGLYMFHQPVLMLNDTKVIQTVLVKEFNKFRDRGLYFNEKVDPLSGHLFFLPGEKWRRIRAKLSPTFTSGKLKQMFPLVKEIGDSLIKTCDKMLEESSIVEIKDLIARYTTDSIATTAFGFNCNSLENPKNEFKYYGQLVFDQNPVKNAIGLFAPFVLDSLGIPLNSSKVINFFVRTFQDMVKYRHENQVVRKDFLNLLMQLIDKGVLEEDEKGQKSNGLLSDVDKERLTIVEAQAQAFVFFVAGFETSASTITYTLYELAQNPEVQDKIQGEIDQVVESGDLTYDTLMNMEYLHMVFSESMRKHPSVPFLNRICIEDCEIPEVKFTVKKGTGIMISTSGLHANPEFFPDPEKFDPTRFTKENIAARSPFVYLPFGDGPRICIGARFAIVQTKIALINLLYKYRFSVCEKTQIPISYSKRAIVQCPEGGLYLRLEKRKK